MRPFTPQEFQAKCQMDIPLFAELFKNYLHESEIPAFKDMLIRTYDLAQELHEEANVIPQISIVSLRSKKKLQYISNQEVKFKNGLYLNKRMYDTFHNTLQ